MNPFEAVLKSRIEEDCQRFLTVNPRILLQTFKRDICIPKFRFGNQFVSDFVLISRPTSMGVEITLVELEPASEKPFTLNGKYARRLNDAVGQINDWFAWLSENHDYFVRTLLTSIRTITNSPYPGFYFSERANLFVDSKIIIGRIDFLSDDDNKRRMAIYRSTNQTIEITHYDRLLYTYQNILEKDKVNNIQETNEDLTELTQSKSSEIRRLVANHKNVVADILETLADDPDPDVVVAVANNRYLTTRLFSKLAKSKVPKVKEALARNPGATSEVLMTLFVTGNDYTRKLILENQNCPEEVLVLVTPEMPIMYQRLAAEHQNLKDGQTLQRFANYDNFVVRIGVAKNPNLTLPLTNKLSRDSHKQVRIAAKYLNVNSTEDILIRGAKKEGYWIRSKIAKHPNLKQLAILKQLAEDESYWVRIGVLENRNTPIKIIEKLMNDPDERVRHYANIRKSEVS